ncbi:D-2-hydroxyacid dehydrogenase [Shewanella sp. SNU WT4]|uniref:D-2-hydroxyacid dehydrogenase n=1 Tax=Shewanella sp. SNU WT4 TaxID=2590015 RepID=UPI00112E09FC|nr:D-2-hydroxyacid dehydrogenase [Shewanella sp. SNU WT4]QDF66060.1 D-2-hydroxyacid dehydrogenase [Shewanella sp. SNU WT4]
MAHLLLLLTKDNNCYRQLLAQQQLPGLVIASDDPQFISKADIWLAEPALAKPLLPLSPALTWMQSTFAGVDLLMAPRLKQDYLLTNVRGIFGPLMSEYLFAHLLTHIRQLPRYRTQQTAGLWQALPHASLMGKHMLILGTGSIGKHLALTARHFGMQVTGVNRSGEQHPEFDQCYSLSDLSRVIATCDILVSVLPSTTDTKLLLNAERLSLLKSDAIIANLGRGDSLDETALYQQLLTKPQQLAILDVFQHEPLEQQHPLWRCPNAIITPHISAPSVPDQVVAIFADNYRKFIQQQPLNHKVDFKRGY